MLKPHPHDPNYKTEMKRFKENPGDWHGTVSTRNLGAKSGAEGERDRRGWVLERLRREFCVHHGINPILLGVPDKTLPIITALYVEAGEDEAKTKEKFDDARSLTMLRTQGLVS